MEAILSQLFNGLSLSSILLLIALGLSITFGIMGVINFAHGEFLMIGAYTAYVMQRLSSGDQAGIYFLFSLPVAFVVAFLLGLVVEKFLIRFLYGRPYESILATWGLSLILQQGARSIFGANNVEVTAPHWLQGGIQLLAGFQLPYSRIFILSLAILAVIGMYCYVNYSSSGRRMRAVMQNRDMSACMGIKTRKVDAFTFAIGSGIAGVAGCAVSLLGSIGPSTGQNYIVDAFMVVVLGGIGSLSGTIAGAPDDRPDQSAFRICDHLQHGKSHCFYPCDHLSPMEAFGTLFFKNEGPGLIGMTKKTKISFQWLYGGKGSLLLFCAVLLVLPLVLSDFRLNLLGKFLTFAIVAIGIDLIWGYTGILSLGHGVFFSLGAYAMGMYLKLQSESLPDFMMWSGLTELPWFWKPFLHAWFAIPMAVLVPVALAVIIGIPTFRARIKGPYFAILTQALALVCSILFIGQQPYTGGTNGVTNLQDVFGYSLSEPATMRGLYLVTAAVLVVVFLFAKWLVSTKMGRIFVAIRDGENRFRFLGYNSTLFKVAVFAISAGLAGLAGALYVPQVGIISPSMMGILPSVEMAIWVAVGGRGSLVGAILGALVVNFAKTYLSETFPDSWLYFQGALFVGVVLLFPQGIIGLLAKVKGRLA